MDQTNNFGFRRKSGILLPVSSLPSPYGIGSFGKAAYDLIELAMKSRANLAVIPIQDYLEQTNAEGRINIPSVADGNWCYRLSNRYNNAKLAQKIAYVTKKSGRATKRSPITSYK
jgi:4-alpha-glucanotransferase